MLSSLFFVLLLVTGVAFFVFNVKKIFRNIKLGRSVAKPLHKKQRWKRMFLLSLGQTKMVVRPVAGVLHILVYVGFFVVNIEFVEIILDGIFSKHRSLSPFFGDFYNVLTAIFEIFALLVLLAVAIFYFRRNVLKISRFQKKELSKLEKNDANRILFIEAFLMFLFFLMNASEVILQKKGVYASVGNFPVSEYLSKFFFNVSTENLILIERTGWWLHFLGILFFLNYLYYSKHLHILSAFPYTYFAPITPKGQLPNSEIVTEQVALMLSPNVDVFSAEISTEIPPKFGASDVTDLTQIQLLSAYACTECGRCTDVCPASATGKKLSPRKIMMATRDRLEEVGKNISKNKIFIPDQKQLLGDYISEEELWACTSCNACVDACPLEINPLSIIMEMRQYLVMEKATMPQPLQTMFSQIESTGSPWGYTSQERENLLTELTSG